MKTFALTSTVVVHTPSVFRLCKDNWVFPENRKWVKDVMGAYNISNKIIVGLMTGKIPVRFEDDSVVFECQDVS